MPISQETVETDGQLMGGFGIIDEKGRLSLSKPVRNALGVQAGSSVAFIVLDHALLLIPQDAHLAALMERGAAALSAAGLTVQDVLDELPAARAEVMREAYSTEFLEELDQLHAAAQRSKGTDGRDA
ncbi:MAG TPA: AbrB/MazE/SpoVT family DNA-binding domain-containing protein [Ktedonobacterales bacterium]|nr:AbrB/MazE/SpoVT family DNA-binding domain-containing protein [Ktedonobacterales bacterium]